MARARQVVLAAERKATIQGALLHLGQRTVADLEASLASERDVVTKLSARAIAAETNATRQAIILKQQEDIIADMRGHLAGWEERFEAVSAERAEAVGGIALREGKMRQMRVDNEADQQRAADAYALLKQEIASERKLVLTLSRRAEEAEREATDQASTIRDLAKLNTDTSAALAACELLVDAERESAAINLAAVQADLAFKADLMTDVLDVAEATERILEATAANVTRLIQVEASLRLEVQAALERAQEESRRSLSLQDDLIAAKEECKRRSRKG